ncbi:response regulator [Pantoea agglomerans]|uniref:response regulator n=1 Tax=Enterobacter agglomerans TaxID=549 RepID=UPI00301DC84A
MKVLIIEDSDFKKNRVRDFLKEEFKDIELEMSSSYNSGLNLLIDNEYDFAIIDMSLPNYDRVPGVPDVEFRTFGGLDLARQIKRRRININFIFLTQYSSFTDKGKYADLESIEIEAKSNHPENFLGCIYYEHAGYDWKDSLVSVVKSL